MNEQSAKHWVFDDDGEPLTTMGGDPVKPEAFGERTGHGVIDALGDVMELTPGFPITADLLGPGGHYRYWAVTSYDGTKLLLEPVA